MRKIFLTSGMTLDDARTAISLCAHRMNTKSGDTVFDEWAVVTLPPSGAKLVAYHGPRVEQFRQQFKSDIRPLQNELEGRKLSVGDFGFALQAEGTAYDACVRIGPQAYLWWNHTDATMTDIRSTGSWMPAQKFFMDLCESFRLDPVVIEES